MTNNDIVIGTTYLFTGSESPTRSHLAGTEFTVVDKKKVFRKISQRRGKRAMMVWRFFNEDGVGARADELGELPKQGPQPLNCYICGKGASLHCWRCDRPICEACDSTCMPQPSQLIVCFRCDQAIKSF